MADALFEDPRLVATYDTFDGPRDDLDHYEAIIDELGARSVLDVGCGTGVLARRLAARGLTVVGVDPAEASLDWARNQPGGESVTWIHGDATSLPELSVDVATMTGNVAQVFLSDDDFTAMLVGVRAALRHGGVFVFETRDSSKQAWTEWTRERTYEVAHVPGIGDVTTWCDLLSEDLPFVSFRWTNQYADGDTVTSDSTLCFRERADIERLLTDQGFRVLDVRDAPDRPGREFVFLAERAG